MGAITLPNARACSDITFKVRLKDNDVAVDWNSLSDIRALIYSDVQRAVAGRCTVSIDGEDSTLLVCNYAASKPQYLGINSIVIRATYQGRTKTYDKKAVNIVARTEQLGAQVTINDPTVNVQIEVTEVDTSLLDDAINAAFDAAEDAIAARDLTLATEADVEAAEALRVTAEQGRVDAEALRVSAESGRVDAEALRVSAESGRVNAENAREIAEGRRVSTMETCVRQEKERADAEELRVAAEQDRVDAESIRVANEEGREEDEEVRIGAETERIEAESARVDAEAARVLAESDRVDAETARAAQASDDHDQYVEDHAVVAGYNTRLTSVEGEVSQLSAEIGEVSVPFTENKDIALGGTIGATISLTPLSESGWRYAIVDCKEGDILTVSGKGGYSTRLWGFLDIDNKLIAVSVVNLEATNLQLVAPANSAKIVVNSSTSASLKLLSCTSAQYRMEELHDEFDGRIDLLEGAVSPSVGGPELTSRQASIKGYATTAGKFQGIGTAGQVFWYIPVESGKTYRMVGTYLVAANVYANILFSADFPVNDAYGTVIDYGKGTGDAFDIHYTAPSDGYLLVWGNANNSSSIYKFYEDEIVSKITELNDVDNDIKGIIGYAEQSVLIGEFSTLKGFATGTGKFASIGEGSAEFKYFPVTKGTKYKISGTYTSVGTYAGIIFSESVPQTDSIGIVIAVAVANQTFEEEYTAQLDGYIFVQASSFTALKYESVDSVVKKTDIFRYCKAGFVKLVGIAYQKLYVGNPSGTIYDNAYGSFVIPVLSGEHYLVRGVISAYTSYAVVAFSTSITPGDMAIPMLVVSENTNPYTIDYDFVSPGDGYLIVFANQTANQYGNSVYVEILKEKYRQPVISDYYLPDTFKLQAFGDSITDNTWGGKSTWVNYIPDNINIASLTVVNSGVGGAGIGGNSEHNIPNTVKYGYQRPDGRPFAPALQNDAELVVIFAGTNDWSAGQPLSSTLANLADTFQYIFEHSKATVLFCTPLGRYNSVDQEAPTDANGDPLNPNGITLREESEELIKVCKRYSVPVLDLNGDAGINRFNIMDYSTDGLHPHRDGDIYVSRLICKKIKELIRN